MRATHGREPGPYTSPGRTIVHGGFGVYYDREIWNHLIDERFRLNWIVRFFDFTEDPNNTGRILWDPSYESAAGLQGLVNSAGTARHGSLLDTRPEDYDVGYRRLLERLYSYANYRRRVMELILTRGGQIEGGFVQGMGWLTTEELWWDDQGRLRTHAPSTYKIPACSDRPPDLRIALWRGENSEPTVHRSKAVGEPPQVGPQLGAHENIESTPGVPVGGPGSHRDRRTRDRAHQDRQPHEADPTAAEDHCDAIFGQQPPEPGRCGTVRRPRRGG